MAGTADYLSIRFAQIKLLNRKDICMRTRSLVISAILISALVLTLAVIAVAADNPFGGTWKMNPAKTKSSYPLWKAYTMTAEAQENGMKVVQDIVDADGKPMHVTYTAKYDGKDYPVTGRPDADTMSFTRPNANTTDYVFRKNGKEAWRGQSVVSKDGKTQKSTVFLWRSNNRESVGNHIST
jgi:hypothetical protein